MRFSNPGTIKTEEKETEEQQNTRNGRHRRTAAALVSDTIEKEKKKNACAVAPASPLVPKKMQRSPHRGGGARSSKRRARVSLWFSNSLRGFGDEAAAKSRRLSDKRAGYTAHGYLPRNKRLASRTQPSPAPMAFGNN